MEAVSKRVDSAKPSRSTFDTCFQAKTKLRMLCNGSPAHFLFRRDVRQSNLWGEIIVDGSSGISLLRNYLAILVLLLGLPLLGCGGRPATAQVSGKVLYKDGTVPQGGVCLIQFQPTGDTSAEVRKAASGNIESDGTFHVFTRKPGDGIFLGKYAVTFSVWKGPMEPVSFVDKKYTKAETTPYTVEIDGDRDDLLFEVERPN